MERENPMREMFSNPYFLLGIGISFVVSYTFYRMFLKNAV